MFWIKKVPHMNRCLRIKIHQDTRLREKNNALGSQLKEQKAGKVSGDRKKDQERKYKKNHYQWRKE